MRPFGGTVEPTDRLFPLLDLPGFGLLFLLRPLDKAPGRFVIHPRPTQSTETELPADGDSKGSLQPLRQFGPSQNRVPVWEINPLHTLRFFLPNRCPLK